MNYETIKSFILIVLVGISFLLSFILWSYQPNYDNVYDTSYVNEVDIGGSERVKSELIEPKEIIFHVGDKVFSFISPMNQQAFFKDLASWVIYDSKVIEGNERVDAELFVELIFPSEIPIEIITNLFSLNEQIEVSDWSFERVFITLNEATQSLEIAIQSVNGQKQIVGTIEKTDAYQYLLSYLSDNPDVHENIAFGDENRPIYVPKNKVTFASQTLAASSIEPELFINTLFSDPSYVTPNIGEAYFTDGQRGMRIQHDGRLLEFFNPIQDNFERLTNDELLDVSIKHINNHKGWTNSFLLENMNSALNNIRYRLHYEGYPVFDYLNISVIEQEWREQELYQYNRPLIRIGNLLNMNEVELPSGEQVIDTLKNDASINVDLIQDIQVGYFLRYLDDTHSLTLDPSWYILYHGEWMRFNISDYQNGIHVQGGD